MESVGYLSVTKLLLVPTDIMLLFLTERCKLLRHDPP